MKDKIGRSKVISKLCIPFIYTIVYPLYFIF